MSARSPQPDIPSFEVNVTTLPRAGFPLALRPDAAERERIARACGVEGFDLLEADLTLTRWRGDGVELRGEVHAIVRQECVVTLEPVTNEIREQLAVTFLPPDSKLARDEEASQELVLDPEGPDIPESFSGEAIDVWPVVVECLILAIDPYPRAPGAELDSRYVGGQEERESPFSVLKSAKIDKK